MFYIGAIVGSFMFHYLSHLYKPYQKESRCDHCHSRLLWYQLIPIVSYIISMGKCLKCKQKITIHYLLVEVLFGCIFIIMDLLSVDLLSLQLNILFLMMFLMISTTDIKQGLIEDWHLMILLFMITLLKVTNDQSINMYGVFKVASLLILFALCFYMYTKKEGIGHGDIKLITCLSFVFSFEHICMIIVGASFLGLIYGIIFRRTKIRFGPFICLVTLCLRLFY